MAHAQLTVDVTPDPHGLLGLTMRSPGTVTSGHARINTLAANGAGARAGLCIGDVVLAVQGAPAPDFLTAVRLLRATTHTGPVQVRVARAPAPAGDVPLAGVQRAMDRLLLQHSISMTSPGGHEAEPVFDFEDPLQCSASSVSYARLLSLGSSDLDTPPPSTNETPLAAATPSASRHASVSSYDSDLSETDEPSQDGSNGRPPLRRRMSHWRVAMQLVRACTVFQRRAYPWVQLAGHSEGFEQGNTPDYILKRSCENEKRAFEEILVWKKAKKEERRERRERERREREKREKFSMCAGGLGTKKYEESELTILLWSP